MHHPTNIYRQLFTGHAVGSWQVKRKTKSHWMIIEIQSPNWQLIHIMWNWIIVLKLYRSFFVHTVWVTLVGLFQIIFFVTGPDLPVELKIHCLKWYWRKLHLSYVSHFKFKQVVCMRRQMLFSVFKYLFSSRPEIPIKRFLNVQVSQVMTSYT